MTTPPTPAGWYPDPEGLGGQRYWDGNGWTEHQTPAPAAPEPPERVGAHRAPEPDEPVAEQPTVEVPLRELPVEPPPITEPYSDATTPTPAEPQAVEPPSGTEPLPGVDNRKTVMWFAGAVAALLLALVLVAVYAFVIRDDDQVQIAAPTTTKTTASTTTETETTTEATDTESPIGAAPAASDGPLEFTVAGIERGTTITDSTNEFLTKDAQGEYIVVRLTVKNIGTEPATFLGTFQKLKAAGTAYSIDDEASFYVGGGFVEIPPGGQADVGVAFDVPPGTVPESIELHTDPISPGVELPV